MIHKDDPQRLSDPTFYAYRIYVEPPENAEIVKRVIEIAKNKGVKPAQIAISWLYAKGVTAPIIGVSKVNHLEEAVEAINIKLSNNEIKYLEEPYKPKPIANLPIPT